MPLDQFIEETYAGLAAGEEQVAVGTAKPSLESFEMERQKAFQQTVKAVKSGAT